MAAAKRPTKGGGAGAGPTKGRLAAELGVSVRTLANMIGRNEISPECFIQTGGRQRIVDYDRALKEGRETLGKRRVRPGPPTESVELPEGVDLADSSTWPLELAKHIREFFLAQIAQQKAEQQAGTLLDAAEVRDQIFTLVRTCRDHLLSIPDQVSDDAAAEDDPALVHRLLTDRIERILNDLQAALIGGA